MLVKYRGAFNLTDGISTGPNIKAYLQVIDISIFHKSIYVKVDKPMMDKADVKFLTFRCFETGHVSIFSTNNSYC